MSARKTKHVLRAELDDVSYSIRAIPHGTSDGRNATGIPVASAAVLTLTRARFDARSGSVGS
jgi:hypothetical protein